MTSEKRTGDLDYLLTMPMGLDVVAVEELPARAPGSSLRARRSTEIRVSYAGPPADLAAMRSISDAWVVVREVGGIGPYYRDLRALAAAVARTDLGPAIARLRQVGLSTRRPLTFGVTCSMRGRRAYRRADVLQVTREGLAAHLYLRPARGSSPALRFWLHLEGEQARLCLALTSRPVGLRERAVSLPASLPGPVAYAMAHLTRPQARDLFVDPVCGSGSIPLERAENWRYAIILAGDSDHQAVMAARANFGPRHKPRGILRWDATSLPLSAGSVDAMACNPPHGIRMRPEQDLGTLYRGILAEAARVLCRDGRLTFLTPLRDVTDGALRDLACLRIERCFVIDLLGQRPYLYIIRRS
ncbi:MAG: methyltransferase [Anaerolineae bacterium]|nr:methyltransferase [Anaerolineae bacterium]